MRRAIASLLVMIPAVLLCGCQGLDLTLGLPARLPKASAADPVFEVMCLWEPGEGRGLDGLPARGFAGQIMFFTTGQKEAVQVDGDVRIYVFDDQGTPEAQSRPIHQFDFSSEAWKTQLRATDFGATYQVFIPYTRKGSHEAQCTLRVRLSPQAGQPLYSKNASVVLNGKKTHESGESLAVAPPSTGVSSIPLQRTSGGRSFDLARDPAPDATASIRVPAAESTPRSFDGHESLARLRQSVQPFTSEADADDEPETEAPSSRRYKLSSTPRDPDAG